MKMNLKRKRPKIKINIIFFEESLISLDVMIVGIFKLINIQLIEFDITNKNKDNNFINLLIKIR